jgi:hypothetical protein
MGGPPVLVPIEPEIYDLIFTEDEPDNLWPTPRPARARPPQPLSAEQAHGAAALLANFDQPDTMTSCAVRRARTHALQALTC